MAMELSYGYHYASLAREDAKYGCHFLSKHCLLIIPKEKKRNRLYQRYNKLVQWNRGSFGLFKFANQAVFANFLLMHMYSNC
jgi:hypothetical protein